VIRAVALGTVALLALTGACLAPDAREGEAGPLEAAPTPEDEVTTVEAGSDSDVSRVETRASGPQFTPVTVKHDIKNRREVQRALEREHPPLLREAGIGGTALIWLYIDEGGVVRDVRIRESSGHEALDRAALDVAPRWA
jgi:TonB family protein